MQVLHPIRRNLNLNLNLDDIDNDGTGNQITQELRRQNELHFDNVNEHHINKHSLVLNSADDSIIEDDQMGDDETEEESNKISGYNLRQQSQLQEPHLRTRNQKISKSHTSPEAVKTIDIQSSRTIPSRLTVLEEPKGFVSPIKVQNRETVLPASDFGPLASLENGPSTSTSQDRLNSLDDHPKRIDSGSSKYEQQQRQLSPSAQTPSILLLLLIGFALLLTCLKLFSQFRGRRRKRKNKSIDEEIESNNGLPGIKRRFWPFENFNLHSYLNLNPSKREKSFDQQTGKMMNLKNQNHAKFGPEQIQLVERRDQDSVEGEVKSCHGSDTARNSMLIFKRKLAKSSLVVATTRATQPRVKLIKARVRRFIDDEAEEMRLRGLQRTKDKRDVKTGEPFFNFKFLYFLLSIFKTREEIAKRGKIFEPNAEKVSSNWISEIDRPEVNFNERVNKDDESSCRNETPASIQPDLKLTAEVHQTMDLQRYSNGSPMDKSAPLDSLLAAPVELGPDSSKLAPGSIAGAEQSSSLSNCSLLFTPSPMNQVQRQQAICACDKLRLAENELRSKSQGQSPCGQQRLMATSNNTNNARFSSATTSPCLAQPIFRPCCSVSPSALNVCESQSISFGPLGQHQAQNRRFKRHYENYYDDENQDAYQRLTASIGAALAFDFEHQSSVPSKYVGKTVGCPIHQHQVFSGELNGSCNGDSSNHSQALTTCLLHQQHQGPTDAFSQQGCKFQSANQCDCQPRIGSNHQNLTSLITAYSAFPCANGAEIAPNLFKQQQAMQAEAHNLYQNSAPVSHPTTSILVQQPSTATPPPPHQITALSSSYLRGAENNFNSEGAVPRETPEAIKSSDGADSSDSNEARDAQKSEANAGKLERRHHRQFSLKSNQIHRKSSFNPFSCELGQSRNSNLNSTNPSPRRMSIAGDQAASYSLNQPDTLLVQQPNQLGPGLEPVELNGKQMGPEATWNKRGNNQSIPFNNNHQANSLGFYNRLEQKHRFFNHRPSDAALYEPSRTLQCQHHHNQLRLNQDQAGRYSNYSSSGGSSSGIGFSGSSCTTNTPTTGNFPYSSFARADNGFISDNFNHEFMTQLSASESSANDFYSYHQVSHNLNQQNLNNHPHGRFQCDPLHYCTLNNSNPLNYHQQPWPMMGQVGDVLSNSNGSSVNINTLAAGNPNRKYSLPVQLESQAAERLSPSRRGRLLFEKNDLQRVDSSADVDCSLPQGRRQSQQGQQEVQSGAPARQERIGSFQRTESRRSSQTITRQSSFWLEDNSLDSMFSQLTTSGVCLNEDDSQIDLNQILTDEVPSAVAAQCANNAGSQRPSLGSLVQSADSIESVKRRPSLGKLSGEFKVEESAVENAPAVARIDSSNSKQTDSQQPPAGPMKAKRVSQRKSSASTKSKFLSSTKYPPPSSSSSSHSSSSSNSTPSPDLGRASERILAQTNAYKCRLISKRHSGAKRRIRSSGRQQKGAAAHQQHSYPLYRRHKDESEDERDNLIAEAASNQQPDAEGPSIEACGNGQNSLGVGESGIVVNGQLNPETSPAELRLNWDQDSASLERQCRELWKLRATLHEDSCVNGDDWNNYHQRLNRRYDSGYRSIEHQFSSSMEGNVLTNSAGHLQQVNNVGHNHQQPATVRASNQNSSSRPQSGCSRALDERAATPANETKQSVVGAKIKESNSANEFTEYTSIDSPTSVRESENKFAEFDLDDVALECLLVEPVERDCYSRSSRSSNESERRIKSKLTD